MARLDSPVRLTLPPSKEKPRTAALKSGPNRGPNLDFPQRQSLETGKREKALAWGIQSTKRLPNAPLRRSDRVRPKAVEARRAPGRSALPALPARPERAPRAEELTAPLAQHPADLLLEVPARLERGEGGSEGGGRAAAAVGLGLHEEDVPAVLLEAPAGGEGGVAPGAQAHGEQRVLLQAPGFRRPHLVHLHQIGRLGSGLGGAGSGGGGPGGHGPVGRRRALASPRPCLARGRRRLPVECPLLPPPRRVQLSLDNHRGALNQLLHRAHAGRGRVAHRGPRGSRLVAGGRPRRQGRGPQQQQQQQRRRRRRAGGGAGPPGAARGASPAHGARRKKKKKKAAATASDARMLGVIGPPRAAAAAAAPEPGCRGSAVTGGGRGGGEAAQRIARVAAMGGREARAAVRVGCGDFPRTQR
ncbi:protein PRRC2A-like [Bubalus kerabau]|uniref:protein PRRC2A-like n=1 Tax=Bubalus carabanensis TaxID=3119969 RepID=UPI00244EB840|nr:protein PRRC2A-like [Bubalus carabanensis]